MRDKNNITIQEGDAVDVLTTDKYSIERTGNVIGFRDENVIIIDSEGEHFEIEPNRLTIQTLIL